MTLKAHSHQHSTSSPFRNRQQGRARVAAPQLRRAAAHHFSRPAGSPGGPLGAAEPAMTGLCISGLSVPPAERHSERLAPFAEPVWAAARFAAAADEEEDEDAEDDELDEDDEEDLEDDDDLDDDDEDIDDDDEDEAVIDEDDDLDEDDEEEDEDK